MCEMDSFLAWMSKGALKWLKHFTITAVLITLGIRLREVYNTYIRYELGFPLHLWTKGAVDVGDVAVHEIIDDPDSLCVARECYDLETSYL